MKKVAIFALLFLSTLAAAAPKSLERELKDLDVHDPIPSSKLSERIYAVQERVTPIKLRPQLSFGIAENFGGSSFLDTNQISAEATIQFTNRWGVAAGYSKVYNKFTASANQLVDQSGFLPDVDYAKSRLELRALYNVFYGKFRYSRLQAFSFDQYFGLGVAQNELASGTSLGPVADAGFVFWFGQNFSLRLGMKDYYYRENRTLSQGYAHNVHGYMQTGVIF